MKKLVALLVLLSAASAFGGDMWLLQGNALAATPDPCFDTAWRTDVLFLNTADATATISFLGTSNDGPFPGYPSSFTIGAQQAATLEAKIGRTRWQPISAPPLWVIHLDVPAGVRVESRLEVGESDCLLRPPNETPLFGKLSFPLVRALAPSGQRQLFLGADNAAADSHINVGIYNAAAIRASGHIEVRRACDDAVVASADVSVAANAVTQFPLTPSFPGGCTDTRATSWSNYAFVTVDQPSFAFISVLSNHPLETFPPVLRINDAIVFTQ